MNPAGLWKVVTSPSPSLNHRFVQASRGTGVPPVGGQDPGPLICRDGRSYDHCHFAPRGPNAIAQGNALGPRTQMIHQP